MKTNSCKAWLYFYQKSIPYLKNAQKLSTELADTVQKELNLVITVTPVAVSGLPFREDARLVLECGKCKGKISAVASALGKILQDDQLSTEPYKVSVRPEEEFGQSRGFGLFGKNDDPSDEICEEVYIDVRLIKNYRTNPSNKVVVFRTSVVPDAMKNVDRGLARNLERYPYFICEMDGKDAVVKFNFAHDVSNDVATYLEQGNGVVVYEN